MDNDTQAPSAADEQIRQSCGSCGSCGTVLGRMAYGRFLDPRSYCSSECMNATPDPIDIAWGIIANVGGGDWTTQTAEWQDAAARWRDVYMHGAPAAADGEAS